MSNHPTIDKLQNISKEFAIDFMVDKILISWLKVSSGPLAFILRPLAKKACEVVIGGGIDYAATEVKYYLDKQNGKIIVKAIYKASQEGNEDDWNDAVDSL